MTVLGFISKCFTPELPFLLNENEEEVEYLGEVLSAIKSSSLYPAAASGEHCLECWCAVWVKGSHGQLQW